MREAACPLVPFDENAARRFLQFGLAWRARGIEERRAGASGSRVSVRQRGVRCSRHAGARSCTSSAWSLGARGRKWRVDEGAAQRICRSRGEARRSLRVPIGDYPNSAAKDDAQLEESVISEDQELAARCRMLTNCERRWQSRPNISLPVTRTILVSSLGRWTCFATVSFPSWCY